MIINPKFLTFIALFLSGPLVMPLQAAPDQTGRHDPFLLDTNVAYGPAVLHQISPAVAYDGTNFLVVWDDRRNQDSYDDIYGTRIDPTGRVLDRCGFKISGWFNTQYEPAVAFDGTNYMVVWTDQRGSPEAIYAARVTTAGVVLDTAGILISLGASGSKTAPAIAFDDTNYFVVWQDYRSGNSDIYGTRLTRDGVVLDSTGKAICTAANGQWDPQIAFDGTNYLVCWGDRRTGTYDDIYGTRVNRAGTALDPSGIAISTAANYQDSPCLSFNGTTYLVAWEDCRSGNYRIYASRVTTTGTVLNPSGIQLTNTTNSQYIPRSVYDGTNHVVVWSEYLSGSTYDNIYGCRVTTGGTVLDPSGKVICGLPGNQNFPVIAGSSANRLVAWHDNHNFYGDIYGCRIDASVVPLSSADTLYSTTAVNQKNAGLAFNGTNYLAVWEDFQDDSRSTISAVRLTQTGTVLDARPTKIPAPSSAKGLPRLASAAGGYLAVWIDNVNYHNLLYGDRFDASGAVLDSAGFKISPDSADVSNSSVASDGSGYLAVWEGFGNWTNDIFASRISSSGAVLDTIPIPVSDSFFEDYEPDVTFDGANYLVCWLDNRNDTLWYNQIDIYGCRVSPAGVVLDPGGFPINLDQNQKSSPRIASNGVNCLAVWLENSQIRCCRIDLSGAIIDTNDILLSDTTAIYSSDPAVCAVGTEYRVVWLTQTASSYPKCQTYGARIGSSGAVLETYLVTDQTGDQLKPCLAAGSSGAYCTAYSCFTENVNSHPAQSYRIWAVIGTIIGAEEPDRPDPNPKASLVIAPNPSCRMVRISGWPAALAGAAETPAKIRIYDASGRLARTIRLPAEPKTTAAPREIVWRGDDDLGRPVANGIYFVRYENGKTTAIGKVTVIR